MKKQLLNKYFRNQCTFEEIREVLNWFQTDEGLSYFEKNMDRDVKRYAEDENLLLYSKVPSENLYSRILSSQFKSFQFNSRYKWKNRLAIAFLVCLILTVSLYFLQKVSNTHIAESEIAYQIITTEVDQHRLITLTDGTKIRLNSNSSVELPEYFSESERSLILRGEAWFEIADDENRPFTITAGTARIRVLGTQFNVKTDTINQSVQVAVAEGKVSLNIVNEDGGGSAILSRNTFAQLDLKNNEILIEQTHIDNYLSWFNGRLYFYDDPLWTVSRYLERIYGVKFQFKEDKLKELPLSIDLAKDDLDTVLEVIKKTLSIEYKYEKDVVIWFYNS